MENLLVLACPLGMGLMMWMMMRGSQGEANVSAASSATEISVPGATPRAILSAGVRWVPHLCLNWKVLAGLVVVGLGVWIAVPSLAAAAIPVLVLAACPLSMLFMARGMGAGQAASSVLPADPAEGTWSTKEAQLAQLKARQAGVQEEQRILAEEIGRLEDGGSATDPTMCRSNTLVVNDPASSVESDLQMER